MSISTGKKDGFRSRVGFILTCVGSAASADRHDDRPKNMTAFQGAGGFWKGRNKPGAFEDTTKAVYRNYDQKGHTRKKCLSFF